MGIIGHSRLRECDPEEEAELVKKWWPRMKILLIYLVYPSQLQNISLIIIKYVKFLNIHTLYTKLLPIPLFYSHVLIPVFRLHTSLYSHFYFISLSDCLLSLQRSNLVL